MATARWRGQNWLAPLQDVKLAYSDLSSSETNKDAQFLRYIPQASRLFEEETRRKFMPFVDTRTFDHPKDARRLLLDEDLLSVTTLTTQNGGQTITSDQYRLLPVNDSPKWGIELLTDVGVLFSISGTAQDANSISGLWGYHQNSYDSGATINEGAAFGASDTVLTVTDGTLFEVGMHLLIDSEQSFVREISTNDLTLQRGINGTTAAAHDDLTTIAIYSPPEDVIEAVAILAARLSKRGAAAGTDLAGTPETGYRVTKATPADVQRVIDRYKRRSVYFI